MMTARRSLLGFFKSGVRVWKGFRKTLGVKNTVCYWTTFPVPLPESGNSFHVRMIIMDIKDSVEHIARNAALAAKNFPV